MTSSLSPINIDDLFVAYNSNDFYYKTTDFKDDFCHSHKCSNEFILYDDGNKEVVTVKRAYKKRTYKYYGLLDVHIFEDLCMYNN